jgi:hypothetical protein
MQANKRGLLVTNDKIKFSIVVSGAPYGSQSAYQFCAAALLAGHGINDGGLLNG